MPHSCRYPNKFANVRGWGLIQGLVIAEADALTSRDIVQACIDRGLLLVPAGPKVVRFVPPLLVAADEIEQATSIVAEAIAQLS